MSLPLAGRVSHCLGNWMQITLDPWILQVGYQIEWTRTPFQVYPAVTAVTSREAFQLVEDEVESLLQKQAVVAVVPPCKDQFISRLFLIEKKDGSYWPVINLKPLNTFIQKEHFKMESASMTAARRLGVLFGPQRCLSCSPNCQGSLQASLFPVGWQNVRIHLLSFWPLQCFTSVHETPAPGNGLLVLPGAADNNLLG